MTSQLRATQVVMVSADHVRYYGLVAVGRHGLRTTLADVRKLLSVGLCPIGVVLFR